MGTRLHQLVDRVHRQPELTAVWVLVALVGSAILVTYSRLPTDELYGVTGSGLVGGASRVVVFLGFPTSLIAIATLPVAYDLAAFGGRRGSLAAIALAAFLLCLTIGIPGVLEEADLDAKWSNTAAAVGVLLALAVTIAALRSGGPAAPKWAGMDTARVVVAVVLLVSATPWIAAELGFYLPGHVFLTGQIRPFAGESGTGFGPAVHHGDHHGLSGVELALAAIALTRVLPRMAVTWRRTAATAYLALMLVYGLANALQDFWLEQFVKRGWTSHRLPSMLRPDLSPAWGALLLAGVLTFVLLLRSLPRAGPQDIIGT